MAVTKKITTVFQFRRSTTAEWKLNKDIIPAAGEPCFDLDLHTLKIGDGKTTYEKLSTIGGASFDIAADGKSIVLEDKTFKLAGFDAAEVGAQPRKTADGGIEWVVPSAETVEGLQSAVAGLQADIESIQEIITPPDGEDGLVTRIETLETKMDGTEEGSVDKKIDKKINEFADRISGDGAINTFKELVDYVATHGTEVADMAADILELQEKVGTESVANQIAAAVAKKVDVEDGKSLVDNTLIEKLKKIEEEARANIIDSISAGGTLLEVLNKNVNIPIATTKSLGLVKGSTEIVVAADGSLVVSAIGIDKITQNDATVLVMDGGGASV